LESAAIVLSFQEKYKDCSLFPCDEYKYYQWFVFATSTLDPILEALLVQLRFTPEEKRDMNLVKKLMETAKSKLEFASNGLGKQNFILGNKFSAADIVLGFSIHFASLFKLVEENSPLEAYLKRLTLREAFQKANGEVSQETLEMQKKLKNLEKENSKLKLNKEVAIDTIYTIPGSRGTRVAWLYEELKVPFKYFNILKEKGFTWIKGSEYAKINPNATVPTMVYSDGRVYFEAGAIIELTLKKYKKEAEILTAGWNQENWNRHNLYLFWCIATIDSRIITLKQFANVILGQSIGSVLVPSSIKEWFKKEVCTRIENDLGDNDYVNGRSFSITDIILGYSLAQFCHSGLLNSASKKIQNYYYNKLDVHFLLQI